MSTNSFIKALVPERVILLDKASKQEALDKLISILAATDQVNSRPDLEKAVMERESLMSTGIGLGIAVPHVRIQSANEITMAVLMSKEPITDYESLDGKPVQLVFMIVAGINQHSDYLRLLSFLSSTMKTEHLRTRLLHSPDAASFFNTLCFPEPA